MTSAHNGSGYPKASLKILFPKQAETYTNTTTDCMDFVLIMPILDEKNDNNSLNIKH